MVEWGDYAEAYRAIHDKLEEILAKLDYPIDPAVQDIVDRADRLLGRIYGSQSQPLKQRVGTHELMVQLVHQGVEYQAGGGGGSSGLVQCQILNEAGDAWINEPYARDISDRAARLLGKVYGSQGEQLLQRAATYDLIVQLRHAGTEIDPRQIRSLTSSDAVDIIDKPLRDLGKIDVAGFDVSLPAGTNNIGDVDVESFEETGTCIHFSNSATGDIVTPTTGKAVKVTGFFFYTDVDIEARLNFKTSDNTIGGIKGKGAVGINLLGNMKKPQGATNEAVEITITGTGNARGWISYEEVQ